MIRLYFTVIISVLIIIPHTVDSFFSQNLINITVIRNITCQLDDDETSAGDFQLCAIREYNGWNGTQTITFTIYNGLRYVNTFRRFIERSCQELTSIFENTDTSTGVCHTPRSFEFFDSMQLCICATDNCNQNMNSCRDSAENTTNITPLFDFMPLLNSIIQCDDTSNASYTCAEHPFINVSLCEEYVKNNSVLCAITINGIETTQTSLIYDNYEAYLDDKIYYARLVLNNALEGSYNETPPNIYYKYFTSAISSVEECDCASYSLCNQNINTCLLQTASQIETTIMTSPSTGISSASFPTATSISVGSLSTSISTSIVPITTAISATIISSTSSETIISTSTASTITSAITSESSTVTSQSTSTINTTAIWATYSTITTQTSIVTSSPNNQNIVQGERGLGSAATAGIACGIIFSVLLFSAEIIYFKFFYSGNIGSGYERSVNYQA